MTTSTLKENQRQKTVKRFRVKIGNDYANLNFDMHEKGVLVRCGGPQYATEFMRNVDAGHAIQRTYAVKKAIQEGMFPTWGKFEVVLYREDPKVEEYQIDAPSEE